MSITKQRIKRVGAEVEQLLADPEDKIPIVASYEKLLDGRIEHHNGDYYKSIDKDGKIWRHGKIYENIEILEAELRAEDGNPNKDILFVQFTSDGKEHGGCYRGRPYKNDQDFLAIQEELGEIVIQEEAKKGET